METPDDQLSSFSALVRDFAGWMFHGMSLVFLTLFVLLPSCWLLAGWTFDKLVDAESELPREVQTFGTFLFTCGSFIFAVVFLIHGSLDDGYPKSPLRKKLQHVNLIAVLGAFAYVFLLLTVAFFLTNH